MCVYGSSQSTGSFAGEDGVCWKKTGGLSPWNAGWECCIPLEYNSLLSSGDSILALLALKLIKSYFLQTVVPIFPTDLLRILELQDLSIGISVLHNVRRSTDFKVPKLRMGRPGLRPNIRSF